MKTVAVQDVPSDAQIIDVREPDEYADLHARGAKNIPMSQIVENVGEIDTDQDVYVICKAGGRSLKCVEYLVGALESENIINVEGGTDAWVRAGLPVEK